MSQFAGLRAPRELLCTRLCPLFRLTDLSLPSFPHKLHPARRILVINRSFLGLLSLSTVYERWSARLSFWSPGLHYMIVFSSPVSSCLPCPQYTNSIKGNRVIFQHKNVRFWVRPIVTVSRTDLNGSEPVHGDPPLQDKHRWGGKTNRDTGAAGVCVPDTKQLVCSSDLLLCIKCLFVPLIYLFFQSFCRY